MPTKEALEVVKSNLIAARYLKDVFGPATGVKEAYHQLLRQCHPDLFPEGQRLLASPVFTHLSELYKLADQRITADTYDHPLPLRDSEGKNYRYTIGKQSLVLGQPYGTGLHSVVYAAELSGESNPVFAKVAHTPKDNLALRKEIDVLAEIRRRSANARREAFLKIQRAYVPKPITAVQAQFADLTERTLSVLAQVPGTCFVLRDLLTMYGKPLELAHAYWIYRRLLLTIAMIQMRAYVHGAITPDHLLIYPEAHGLMLIDWCNACRLDDERIRTVDPTYREWYPPEVFKKQPVNPTTDVYMAGKIFYALAQGNTVPPRVAQAVDQTLQNDSRRRPQSVMNHFDHFERVIEQVHGKRRFVNLEVPAK